MINFPEVLENRLEEVKHLGCHRALHKHSGVDFCSNDYLGFSHDSDLSRLIQEAVKEYPSGSTGSRLLRGHSKLFEDAESELAEFSNRESALIFSSGYQANVGLLSALLKPGDIVYSDELNHASLIDGIRLSGAKKRIFAHGDLNSLRALLREDRSAPTFKLVVTESLFSMEGDFSDLKTLKKLTSEFGASLVVDEAHTTGLFDSGLVEQNGLSDHILATLHTGGKALGVSGAWISCDQKLKEYLINFSRSFIFSTAPSPYLPLSLQMATRHLKEVGKSRVAALVRNIVRFSSHVKMQPDHPYFSPIIPIIFGSTEAAVQAGSFLQNKGFDVRAIRPPTVPEGKARLRITLKSFHRESEVDELARHVTSLRKEIVK